MKSWSTGPIPWDIAVFLTITGIGFGYSVQKLAYRDKVALNNSHFEIVNASTTPFSETRLVQKTLDLGCLEHRLPREKLVYEDGQLRLKGKICSLSRSALRSFDGVRIRNLTTKSEATIFFRSSDATFITDYVSLTHGENKIEIEWKNSKSAPVQTVMAEVTER